MVSRYYSGLKAGQQIYIKGLKKHGLNEAEFRKKAVETCRNYANNLSLKYTRKGKELTPSLRYFYMGVADYLEQPYRTI